ncbi:hypothetical protein Sgly_2550 [Syntrophobotulus glycolicus DSM 8271]|uniref:PQ loop repeat protein n=1 Tax=Syntrophobotulus glycolicus (strain DSM 8271 / FlGlyR) TaxID=645991 RepID=F0SW48_SYNGF|nr:hypothetical protein [Syntrophobotulus glycolicus]ADY56832.1 hypothetical protein Sgly_2550 [Syntrophobotulus glycolicus DSM 8271]
MSIFEIIMLVCFGAAWPFSIYKAYTSRSIKGKSASFLIVILIGYAAGILNKIYYRYDEVVYLYLLNFIMVSTDLLIYFRNRWLNGKEDPRKLKVYSAEKDK